ncbi:heparan-alpha-glucosaminide N-acetyltransferase domain-containing protein (plasmid) [Hymenobacter tibetensis]|uniref:Heparan-alpha-glucosaminide N-acetyltransferase domain-containing protein n=1 Tax=Hymenobacter tibetensis TaxID=497967 RepID=A0ABY4D4U9_9BACT|nr:heparan-alpha-glucosaminide N-acetyltransferase domain-containing protein [Hymenobacter tibetensis]UOG77480.1 heparan-alpha-glucosaminide N-acetyltransferase domain-containing protein [Hymenobacter tibetensis]
MLQPTSAPVVRPARVQAIDIVRGLVMVVMALDHVRDFWSYTPFKPDDLTQTTTLFFFTRWITHFCAPTFVFLSGVSIWLTQQRRGSRGAMSRFLLTRGLWLIGLELVVFSGVLQWGYGMLLLLILWAIGGSMVLLSGLLWLPRPILIGLAALILLGHDALPFLQPVTAANVGWALLHNSPFGLPLPGGPLLLVAYSLGPWLGVLLAGYLVGPWFQLPLLERTRRLRLAGVALLVLFVGLRATNWYGDPQPWAAQPRGGLYTVLSFLNVSKYPPSLLFCCLTLGAALLLLSVAEELTHRPARWLRTYGQVPFFFYLLHLLLISGAAWVWTRLAFGYPVNLSFTPALEWPPTYHFSLVRCYSVWVAVVLVLYWPCRWYQAYKQRHTYWWLSYL